MRREELFTLTAAPAGPLAPGTDVELTLVVPNLSDATAPGMNVRFLLPPDVIAEHADEPIDLAPLEPGDQLRVSRTFRLAAAIPAGTVLVFSAEIGLPHGRIVGTNRVAVRVISTPRLSGSSAAIARIGPGRYRATIALVNDGDADATDARVVIPAPIGTHAADGCDDVVACAALRVGEPILLEREFVLDERFAGAFVVLSQVQVACSSTDPVVLPASACEHGEQARLADATLACEPLVAGQRARIRLRAFNPGPLAASSVDLHLRTSAALALDARRAQLHGAPIAVPARGQHTRAKREAVVQLGTIAAGTWLDVLVPVDCAQAAANGTAATIEATLVLDDRTVGELASTGTIQSLPRFSTAGCELALVADPLDGSLAVDVRVINEGTALARNAIVTLTGAAVFSGCAAPHDVRIGDLAPRAMQSLRVPIAIDGADGARVPIGATVSAEDLAPLQLAPIAAVARAHARIEADGWLIACGAGAYDVRLTNFGSDAVHDLIVTLAAPAGVRIDPAVVTLGTLAAGATRASRVRIDDRPASDAGEAIAITGIATARGGIVRRLDPVSLDSQVDVRIAARSLDAQKSDAMVGESLAYTLHVELAGDARADKLIIAVPPIDGARYVPGSTRINGHALVDGPGAHGAIDRAIVLRNVSQQTLTIRFAVQIDSCDTAAACLAVRACVTLGEESLDVDAPLVNLHAKAPIPLQPLDLGFALDGVAIGLPEQSLVPERHAGPEAEQIEPSIFAPLDDETTLVALGLDASECATIARYLRASRVDGFVRHILALRALVADRSPGSDAALCDAIAQERGARKSVLDRLLIKLRLPGFAIEAADLEDRSMRTAITGLLSAAQTPSDGPFAVPAAVARIACADIRAAMDRLIGAPLGSNEPFFVLAHFIGTDVAGDRALTTALRSYRDALLDALRASGDPHTFAAHPLLDDRLDDVLGVLESKLGVAA